MNVILYKTVCLPFKWDNLLMGHAWSSSVYRQINDVRPVRPLKGIKHFEPPLYIYMPTAVHTLRAQFSTVTPTERSAGCTLQINEPQLQRSKHQRATHQRLSTSTMWLKFRALWLYQKLCRSTAQYINEKTLECRLYS